MKDQLTSYVDLLFAGAPHAVDIKQEITQNTLDRYDDLIAQGKSPQAAYQLAICGIGDINELLSTAVSADETAPVPYPADNTTPHVKSVPLWKRILRAIAICLYIISPIPLFVLDELGMATFGLCGTLTIVAVATAMIVIAGSKAIHRNEGIQKEEKPESELYKAIDSAVFAVGLVIYIILSLATQAWYITWVIFPLIAAVNGLIKACFDLKEANSDET